MARSNYSRGSIEQIGNTLAFNRENNEKKAKQAQLEALLGRAGQGDQSALQELVSVNPAIAQQVASTQKTLNDQQKADLFEDVVIMQGLPHDQRIKYMGKRAERLKALGRDPTETLASMQEGPEQFQQGLDGLYQQGVQLGFIKAGRNDDERFGLKPVYGTDAQGNTVLLQPSNMGGVSPVQLPDGVTVGKDPVRIDAGDQVILLDPVSRTVIGSIPKNVSPDNQPQNAAAKTTAVEQAKVDVKAAADAPKTEMKKAITEQGIQSTLAEIDNGLDQIGFFTTGFIGKVGSYVPGTDAYNMDKVVTTIKANLGFDRLQAMRDASPTGGALGQVAIQELEALQSSVASLEVGQSASQLRRNLAKIKQHYTKWRAITNKARTNKNASGGISGNEPISTGGRFQIEVMD